MSRAAAQPHRCTCASPRRLRVLRFGEFFSALLLRMAVIDGAYFGTTFPHLLMMTHPDLFERRPFRAFKLSSVVPAVVAQRWRLEYGR